MCWLMAVRHFIRSYFLQAATYLCFDFALILLRLRATYLCFYNANPMSAQLCAGCVLVSVS